MPTGKKTTKGKSPERIQKAYDLRREGRTFEDIASILKVGVQTARNYVCLAEGEGRDKLKHFWRKSPEVVNPGMTAEVIEKSMESVGLNKVRFMELAAEAGMPAGVASGLYARMHHSYAAITKEMRILKGEQLIEAIRAKRSRVLDFMDDYSLANASAKDLSIIFGILTEKLLLLEGKPTQIYDVQVSHRIESLMPAFMAEAKRRGITFDATQPPPIDVTPVEVTKTENLERL